MSLYARILSALLSVPVYLLSLLPLFVLYRLSDLLFIVSYYFFPYRKRVLLTNLLNSFPEKDKDEILAYAREFYRHFCDLFVECLKAISISNSALKRRVEILNEEVLTEALEKEEGLIFVSSHYANYEWSFCRVGLLFKEKYLGENRLNGLYKIFKNRVFDKLVRLYRQRWGWNLIPLSANSLSIIRLLKSGRVLGLLIDQSPSRTRAKYFTPFLHQLTPFSISAARICFATDAQMIFVHTQKLGRGRYQVIFKKIDVEEYREQDNGIFHLTDEIARLLEEKIQSAPPYWLWTHKRWKHKFRNSDSLSDGASKDFHNRLA